MEADPAYRSEASLRSNSIPRRRKGRAAEWAQGRSGCPPTNLRPPSVRPSHRRLCGTTRPSPVDPSRCPLSMPGSNSVHCRSGPMDGSWRETAPVAAPLLAPDADSAPSDCGSDCLETASVPTVSSSCRTASCSASTWTVCWAPLLPASGTTPFSPPSQPADAYTATAAPNVTSSQFTAPRRR